MQAKNNKFPIDINKDKDTNEKEKDRHKGMRLTIRIPSEDYAYYSKMLTIFNGLTKDGKPVLGSRFVSMPKLCRMALNFFCNTFRDNLFADPQFIERIDGQELIREFIEYRDKYMKEPNL